MKKAASKTHNIYILPAVLLVTIALLITVTIYCYLVNVTQNKRICYHFTLQITN